MDLGEIKDEVKSQSGDESGALITDADITRWVNFGQIDLVRKTDVLQEHAETDAVASDGSYTVPDDYVKLRRVTYDGQKLARTNLEELDNLHPNRDKTNPTGTPTHYYVWGRKLWVYPAPANLGVGLLDIYYVPRPAELINDSDIPEVPVTMHEDLVRYCLARAKEKDEETQDAQNIMADYENRVMLSRDESQNEEIDSYPAVRLVSGDDY